MSLSVNIVVEDALSEAVLRSLLANSKRRPKVINSYPIKKSWETNINKSGYGYIKKNLIAFNEASESEPFIVLIDADNRLCPPKTIAAWLNNKQQHKNLTVRIAIREVESWLLADKTGIGEFLSADVSNVPEDTDTIDDPKKHIANLALSSSRKEIREDVSPVINGGEVGPFYTAAMSNFAKTLWNIKDATKRSNSLQRAVKAFNQL